MCCLSITSQQNLKEKNKTTQTKTTCHAVTPGSLTVLFAHATALAMSFSINDENKVMRNETTLTEISFKFILLG